MKRDLEERPSLYDLEQIMVDATRWTNRDRWEREREKQFVRLVVSITGKAHKRMGSDKMEKDVVNELVEVRLLTLSNYKSVFIKFSKDLLDFLFGDVDLDRKKSWATNRFKYENDQWIENACHDSCWREGFKLASFFDSHADFKVVEVGIAQMDNLPEDSREKEKALLGTQFVLRETWNIDTSNRWEFWFSFMKSMDATYHANTFMIQLTRVGGDSFVEDVIYANIGYEGEASFLRVKPNSKQKTVRFEIKPLKGSNVYLSSEDMKLNFMNKNCRSFDEQLGMLTLGFVEDGYKVQVVKER